MKNKYKHQPKVRIPQQINQHAPIFKDKSKYERKGKVKNTRCPACWEALEHCICDDFHF